MKHRCNGLVTGNKHAKSDRYACRSVVFLNGNLIKGHNNRKVSRCYVSVARRATVEYVQELFLFKRLIVTKMSRNFFFNYCISNEILSNNNVSFCLSCVKNMKQNRRTYHSRRQYVQLHDNSFFEILVCWDIWVKNCNTIHKYHIKAERRQGINTFWRKALKLQC